MEEERRRYDTLISSAVSILALAAGPIPPFITDAHGPITWPGDREVARWIPWRSQYAEKLLTAQPAPLEIVFLLQFLHWAAASRAVASPESAGSGPTAVLGAPEAAVRLVALLVEQSEEQRAALLAHPPWVATLIRVAVGDAQKPLARPPGLASLAWLAW